MVYRFPVSPLQCLGGNAFLPGPFFCFSFLDIVLRGLMKVVLRIHGVRENLFFPIFLRRVTYSTLSQTYPWTYLLS